MDELSQYIDELHTLEISFSVWTKPTHVEVQTFPDKLVTRHFNHNGEEIGLTPDDLL